jgi:hypothetical protein
VLAAAAAAAAVQVEMKALDELMSHKLPRLYQHFQQVECDISIIATDWYLCLFTTSMPSETVARVWDSLFNEGPKIIFRVALALLKMHEDVILTANNAGGWRAAGDGGQWCSAV